MDLKFNTNKNRFYTNCSIIFLSALLVVISFSFDLWHYNRNAVDAPSYYGYLPSTFIYHDLKLNYVDKNPSFFQDKIWFVTLPTGKRVFKSTIGMSIMFSPFFFTAHALAPSLGYPRDGYSWPYQNARTIGVWLYLITGLYFLSKVLLRYFPDKAVALTLIALVAGTNLLWYITFEGLMNHGISFSLLCLCIYLWIAWLEEGTKKKLILFTIAFTLVVLVRTLSSMLFTYFLIGGVLMKGGLKSFFLFLKPQLTTLVICILVVALMILPQLIYWHYATGHWLVDAYFDEHFYFFQPYTFSFLFGFRKGWFIYTPVMLLAALGIILMYKTNRAIFYATLISVSLTAYIFSCWWAWSYGISWGMRPMLDSYSFMSLPLAATFSFILSRKHIWKIVTLFFVSLLVMFNLFQTWQYKNGLIHYDDMTKESYLEGFFQTEQNPGWMESLKPFDWIRRKMGFPEIEYSKSYFEKLSADAPVYLRGCNMGYLSAGKQSDYIIICNNGEVSKEELFQITRLGGDTIAIKSSEGKFVSVKNNLRGMAIADAVIPSACEKFVLELIKEDDNRVALKACNGNYLAVTQRSPYIVGAVTGKISMASTFRLFVLDKK